MPKTLPSLFVGIIVGAMAGAFLCGTRVQSRAEGDSRSVALAHQLEVTGLCANALRTMAADHQDSTTRMLKSQLGSSLRRAQALLSEGVVLPGHYPNLREAAHRANEYYREQDPANEFSGVAHDVSLALQKQL